MIDSKYKNHYRRFFRASRKFRKEYRKELRTLIIVTLGFTIAFTWRQTLFDISQSFVQWITHVQTSASSSLMASIFITLVCLSLIWVTSHLIKESPDEKYS